MLLAVYNKIYLIGVFCVFGNLLVYSLLYNMCDK